MAKDTTVAPDTPIDHLWRLGKILFTSSVPCSIVSTIMVYEIYQSNVALCDACNTKENIASAGHLDPWSNRCLWTSSQRIKNMSINEDMSIFVQKYAIESFYVS